MSGLLRRVLVDERGAISIEYALTAGLLGVATALAFTALGDALDQMYEPIAVVAPQGRSLPNDLSF